MASLWTYRVHMIVRVAEVPAANAFVVAHGPGGEAEDRTFSAVQLSALGTGAATDLGCNTLMTQEAFMALVTAAQTAQMQSLRYFCLLADNDILVETNQTDAQGSIGQPWRFNNSLSAMNLKVIHDDRDNSNNP